jgi:polysaccharide biosynthesis transport protein
LENQNRLLLASARGSGGDPQIAAAEAALATAQAQYSDSHPDVTQARERLRQLRALPRSDSGAASFIQEQIQANNQTIASLSQQRDAAIGRAGAAMAGSARAPAILERAMQLESRASALREQHRSVATDLLKAQNSARMAGERRAERLSLVDAPDLPDTPHSPNRPLFIGGGLAAGLAVGLLLALIAEFMSRPLRSPLQIQAMGFPVLGLVPVLGPSTRSGVKSFFKRSARRFAWPVRQTS